MKIKKQKLLKFQSKIDTWLKHYKKGNCSGTPSFTEEWNESENGLTALKALYVFESTGKKPPTREIQLLETYLQAKAHLDLNIKNWATDRAKGWLGKIEFTEIIKELGYPDWVFKAVENQKAKLYRSVYQCL